MQIIIAILVFSVIVIIHEIGHFVAARKCGILVEEFSIGMGPKLVGIKRGETLYAIRLFPIGGSCRMLGDEVSPEQSADDTPSGTALSNRSFTSKSVPKRFLVISGGIIMNMLLAFVVAFAAMSANGFIDAQIESIVPGYGAEQAGLLPGDRINRVNGSKVNLTEDVRMIMDKNFGETITLEIIRDGKKLELAVTPRLVEDAETGARRYLMGYNYHVKIGMFAKVDKEVEEIYSRAGLWETIKVSFNTCIYYVKHTVAGIVQLVTGKADKDQFSGIIGMVGTIGETYEQSITVSPWAAFWNIMSFVAALSANLAVFNFLPLPALDGGRMIFLLLEAVRGKPVSPEREGFIHFAGFVLLMIFAVFVAYNDILKLI